MKTSYRSGFSLIELLVVMGLLAIILSFAIPATSSLMKGNNLTRASQTVINNLSLARQTAIAKNRNVEVRFLKFADEELGQTTEGFRGIQTVEVLSSSKEQPLDRMEALPVPVIIDGSAELSNILNDPDNSEKTGTESLGRLGNKYSYVALRFRPNGSVELSPTEGPWFITLHEQKGNEVSSSQPPANFVTIEIDPMTGGLKFYRPGV